MASRIPWLGAVIAAFADSGINLSALGLSWARALPTVVLVPAFGLRALPILVRVVLGLMLALCIFPAVGASTGGPVLGLHEPWPLVLIENVVRGIPIALAAAIPLWAATMAGNLVDTLRGTRETLDFDVVPDETGHMGIVLSLLAATLFLQGGGPSRVALALATHDFPAHPLLAAMHDLVAGISLAVALAGPLLAASIVLEVAIALMSRASSPAQVYSLFPPLRALATVAVIALVLERIAVFLGRVIP